MSMRSAYVTMIGGTLLVAALLAGAGMLFAPHRSVSPVSARDAEMATSGSASEQAAALEAAEQEARENPPPPSASVVMEQAPQPSQATSSAPSGYQGSAPTPTIQFSDPQTETSENPPTQPATGEE